MESWQFIQSPAGQWYWLCSNVISRQTRTSAATFETRMECVANAMASGYQKIAASASSPPNQKPLAPRPPKHGKPASGAPTAAKRAQRRNRGKAAKRSKAN